MKLEFLKNIYKIVKLHVDDKMPDNIIGDEFYSITKTNEEISIVINENIDIDSKNIECGWKTIKIVGNLDFALVGILAKISKALVDNNISIFVI